jgi:hypothetical protein
MGRSVLLDYFRVWWCERGRHGGIIGGRQLEIKGRFVGLRGRRAKLAGAAKNARGTTDRAVLAGAAGRLV